MLVHLGWHDINQHHLMFSYVKRDIVEGQRQGCLMAMRTELALGLVGASAIAGIQVMMRSRKLRDVPQETAAAILRALGRRPRRRSPLRKCPFPKPSCPRPG